MDDKNIIVIGSDTYWGTHLVRHCRETGMRVFEYTQEADFHIEPEAGEIEPEDAVSGCWVFICIEPELGFERYTAAVRKICGALAAGKYAGDVCLLSSASLCMPEPDCRITENTVVCPRNEHDLALATGENLLNVLAGDGYVTPHIMRTGVPYGSEIQHTGEFGPVNRMTAQARKAQDIKIPMVGEAKRSLTHISDICRAVISLVNADYCPPLINIPGEEITFEEIGTAIADKYGVSFRECGLSSHSSKDFFIGDQELSPEYFNETVDFSPRHTFRQWLAAQ